MAYQKMNPLVKTAWVDALRSGEYTQGVGILHNTQTGGSCCLGVLCEEITKNGLIPLGVVDKPNGIRGYNDHYATLPPEVREFSGLSENGGFWIDGRYLSLAELNDAGSTFDKIADLIEKYL